MKIAFTTTSHTGVDTNVRIVSRWLADNGHTVHIVQQGMPPDSVLGDSRIQYHTVRPTPVHYYMRRVGIRAGNIDRIMKDYEISLAYARKLREIRATQGLDLAELNDHNFTPGALQGLPYIYKMHGPDWLFKRFVTGVNYRTQNKRLQMNAMKQALQVHVVSRSQADFVLGISRLPVDKIHVTYNPLDMQSYTYKPLPSIETPYRLLAIGRIEPRKGHDILLRAMPTVWEAHPDVELTVLKGSSDNGFAELKDLIPEAVHQGRLHFVSFVSDEELLRYYERTHIYVTAARYETFGYTILEAMAIGRPVIATDVGPIPELVRPDETGWLFRYESPRHLAKTIIQTLQQKSQWHDMSRNARTHAERFDVEVLMPRQLELYQEALASTRSDLTPNYQSLMQ